MTFLELCVRLREEAGISGSGPQTVVGQSGEMKRIVNWVNQAWEDIQNHRANWNWMRGDFSFDGTDQKADYTPAEAGIASRFRDWDVSTIKSYKTDIGVANEFELGEMPYRHYRSIYLTGYQAPGVPVAFAVSPSQQLLLGPKPDGIYTISGQYWKGPQALALDADVPEMPEEFHMLIVWMALERYGLFESAGEVVVAAQKYIKRLLPRLEINQLPDVTMPDPLA
jgi:hypothetical protein